METKLSVIMYHYVRDFENTKHPGIKGLDIREFRSQLDYLESTSRIISVDDLVDILNGESDLKGNLSLLTFDDGYIDHYKYVYPELKRRGISGAFYPVVKAVEENIVLDVNKIHYILANCDNILNLKEDLLELIDCHRSDFNLESNEYYLSKYELESRFDNKETIFIKRMLQKGLSEKLRDKISSILFEKYVGIDEDIFSKKLYMKKDQLIEMKDNGMHIGLHSVDHKWLSSLSYEEQRIQLEENIKFLSNIGQKSNLSIAYPYGDYNQDTLRILEEYEVNLGFTTEVKGNIILKNLNSLTLARFDTNDIKIKY